MLQQVTETLIFSPNHTAKPYPYSKHQRSTQMNKPSEKTVNRKLRLAREQS